MYEKLRVLTLCSVVFIGMFFCFPNEFRTTLGMDVTVSQQQSTKARIISTHAAWTVFKDNRRYYLFGQGSGSYSYAVDRILNQDSTQTYTTLAPNLPILLLIEKGIIGLLFYLFLVLNVCINIYIYRKVPDVCIIGCTFLALMMKEMTQANLFCVPFVWLMFYSMLAFLQRRNVYEKNTTLERYILSGMVTTFYLGWYSFTYFHMHNESLCSQSFIAMKRNEIQNAINLIERTDRQTPYLIQRGRLYTQCYQKTKDIIYAQRAKLTFMEAHEQHPGDVQINYLQARLYLYMEEASKARFVGERLVKVYPKNSLYLLVLWESLYKEKQKNASLPYLINAIRYTPRILTMQLIQDIQNTDFAYFQTLQQQLLQLMLQRQSNPTDMARLGCIIHWCGNQVKAKEYLREAITNLPNLSTPWHLLGEDKKYRLLVLGAFQKEQSSLPSELEMTEEVLFTMEYEMKFLNWYGCELRDFKR